MPFALGTRALGICDRCGRSVLLNELREEVQNQNRTGLRVCEDCDDVDNPQLWVGRVFRAEPQALQNPRPDAGAIMSRAIVAWNPVHDFRLTVALGTVRVLTA